MIHISKIDFGDIDANQDDVLAKTFVGSRAIRAAVRPAFWIVSGEKGSGKSAIKCALENKNLREALGVAHLYDIVCAVEFDKLAYEAIEQPLAILAKEAELAPVRILMNLWTYVLITQVAGLLVSYGFKATVGGLGNSSLPMLATDIDPNSGISVTERFSRLLRNPLEKFFFGNDGSATVPVRTPINQPGLMKFLLSYPLEHPEYKTLQTEIFQFLKERELKVVVVLDGFDRVCAVATDPGYNAAIFEALCEAVMRLRGNRDVRSWMPFKVLLPHDRFLPILLGEKPLRDGVKVRAVHGFISWSRSGLMEMACNRILNSLAGKRYRDDPWGAILPKTIRNSFYETVHEGSFDYILRHTMWRPRHILQHLRMLSNLYPDQEMTEEMVHIAVAKTCSELVLEFFEEYYIDHIMIKEFVRSFRAADNVMPFGEFRGRVDKAIARFDTAGKWKGPGGFNRKIEALYRMGFFGIVREIASNGVIPPDYRDYLPPWSLHTSKYIVDFYYRSASTEPAHMRLDDSTLVAMHPIFFDHCEMKPHRSIIVG